MDTEKAKVTNAILQHGLADLQDPRNPPIPVRVVIAEAITSHSLLSATTEQTVILWLWNQLLDTEKRLAAALDASPGS